MQRLSIGCDIAKEELDAKMDILELLELFGDHDRVGIAVEAIAQYPVMLVAYFKFYGRYVVIVVDLVFIAHPERYDHILAIVRSANIIGRIGTKAIIIIGYTIENQTEARAYIDAFSNVFDDPAIAIIHDLAQLHVRVNA